MLKKSSLQGNLFLSAGLLPASAKERESTATDPTAKTVSFTSGLSSYFPQERYHLAGSDETSPKDVKLESRKEATKIASETDSSSHTFFFYEKNPGNVLNSDKDAFLDGGAGHDIISFATAASGVRIDLDFSPNVKQVIGSTHDDTFHVTKTDLALTNNHIIAILVDGNGGWDTVSFEGSSSSIVLNYSTFSNMFYYSDTFSHSDFADGNVIAIAFVNIENFIGSHFNDIIFGADVIWGSGANMGARANDTFNGGSGDDVLRGALGDDMLLGGDGNDQIWGGQGEDQLFGGQGRDSLTGGRGADIIDLKDSPESPAIFPLEQFKDTVFINGLGDAGDVIRNFQASGDEHDVLDLDALFDKAGIAALADRAGAIHIQSDGALTITIGGTTTFLAYLSGLDLKDIAAIEADLHDVDSKHEIVILSHAALQDPTQISAPLI